MFTMIISNVKGHREEYRRQKAAMTLRKPIIDAGVIAFAAKEDASEPAILKIADWPAFDELKMKEIKTRSACFIDEVNKESPPLDNETIIGCTTNLWVAVMQGRHGVPRNLPNGC